VIVPDADPSFQVRLWVNAVDARCVWIVTVSPAFADVGDTVGWDARAMSGGVTSTDTEPPVPKTVVADIVAEPLNVVSRLPSEPCETVTRSFFTDCEPPGATATLNDPLSPSRVQDAPLAVVVGPDVAVL
jgi:hypothetical protein